MILGKKYFSIATFVKNGCGCGMYGMLSGGGRDFVFGLWYTAKRKIYQLLLIITSKGEVRDEHEKWTHSCTE